jgi:hypothetical protein
MTIKAFVLFALICAWAILSSSSGATAEAAIKPATGDFASLVYFTGIGCPHCANVDSVLLKQKIRQGNLLVVEYEIYRDTMNAPLLMAYDKQFDTGLGVPMIVVEDRKGGAIVGDTPILKVLDDLIIRHKGNGIVLPAGERSFGSLSLADLPRLPKIWFKNRVAVRKDRSSRESESIKVFLLNGTKPLGCLSVNEKEVSLSGDKVVFANACKVNGWLLMHD